MVLYKIITYISFVSQILIFCRWMHKSGKSELKEIKIISMFTRKHDSHFNINVLSLLIKTFDKKLCLMRQIIHLKKKLKLPWKTKENHCPNKHLLFVYNTVKLQKKRCFSGVPHPVPSNQSPSGFTPLSFILFSLSSSQE